MIISNPWQAEFAELIDGAETIYERGCLDGFDDIDDDFCTNETSGQMCFKVCEGDKCNTDYNFINSPSIYVSDVLPRKKKGTKNSGSGAAIGEALEAAGEMFGEMFSDSSSSASLCLMTLLYVVA